MNCILYQLLLLVKLNYLYSWGSALLALLKFLPCLCAALRPELPLSGRGAWAGVPCTPPESKTKMVWVHKVAVMRQRDCSGGEKGVKKRGETESYSQTGGREWAVTRRRNGDEHQKESRSHIFPLCTETDCLVWTVDVRGIWKKPLQMLTANWKRRPGSSQPKKCSERHEE